MYYGKLLIAPAAEWRATALLAPMRCPKCGSMHTYPVGLRNAGGLLGPGFYREIWDINDKKND